MPILAAPKRLAAPPVSVDFPRRDEMIVTRDYTVRVSAPRNAKTVEVSIDREAWTACRAALGYWWYDWSGLENGEHEVIARVRGRGVRRLRSEAKEFFVVLQEDEDAA